MVNPDTHDNFKDPNIIERSYGALTLKVGICPVPDLEATRSAFINVGLSEFSDHLQLEKGINDYTRSLKDLVDAFDTFMKENNKNKGVNNFKTGQKTNFILTDENDFTIYLIWQIRHVLTHHGYLIDQTCKEDYERAYSEGVALGTHPVISLPATIPLKKRFCVSHDQYYAIKIAIFRYMEKLIPRKDWEQLALRSSIINEKIGDLKLRKNDGNIHYEIDAGDLIERGIEIKYQDGGFLLPIHNLDFPGKRIIFISDGTAVPITIIK